MRIRRNEAELRKLREKSMKEAVDAFWIWLAAHSDATSFLYAGEWELMQSQFLDGLKTCTNAKRERLLEDMGGR